MPGRPRRNVFLVLALVLFVILATAALSQVTAFILLGLLWTWVILFLEGYLRFARIRRFFRTTGQGVWQLVRTRRISKASLRNLAIAVGVIVLIVLLNQLQLSAPGEGRGLSMPTEALSLNFGGINSPGAWVATIIAYSIIVSLLGLGWLRLWQEARLAGGEWRTRVYLACILSFLALPLFFAILMATVAPKDPEDNVEFSKMVVRTIGTGMAFAFSAAVALPFIGDERPRPVVVTAPPPVAPTYAPFAPVNRPR